MKDYRRIYMRRFSTLQRARNFVIKRDSEGHEAFLTGKPPQRPGDKWLVVWKVGQNPAEYGGTPAEDHAPRLCLNCGKNLQECNCNL